MAVSVIIWRIGDRSGALLGEMGWEVSVAIEGTFEYGECDVRAASTRMVYSDDAPVWIVSMVPPSAMTSFERG